MIYALSGEGESFTFKTSEHLNSKLLMDAVDEYSLLKKQHFSQFPSLSYFITERFNGTIIERVSDA